MSIAVCVARDRGVVRRGRRSQMDPTGMTLMAAAALGAAIALFSTTWSQIKVAAPLTGAVAAASVSVRRRAARG